MKRRRTIAGCTLVEALLATALMGAILAAIATVTAQWLPNWNRGFIRVQGTETLAVGLERILADLAAAEFVTAGANIRQPVFDGTELSVTFLRTAIGPNTRPGLEVVRIMETPGHTPESICILVTDTEDASRDARAPARLLTCTFSPDDDPPSWRVMTLITPLIASEP